MVKSKRLTATVTVALLAGSLLGCQASPPNSLPIAPSLGTGLQASLVAPEPFGISQANQQQESDPLNLTTDQQRQLEAISREGQSTDRSSQLQKVLLAVTIDAAALRPLLIQTAAEIDQSVSAQVKMRNVLTTEQRQKLIQLTRQVEEAPTTTTSMESQMQAMAQQMNLTTAQKTVLAAMNTAIQKHNLAYQSRLQKAYIALIETGDGSTYRAALIESNSTSPVDAMIAFFSSLSQAQRQKAFSSQSGSQTSS